MVLPVHVLSSDPGPLVAAVERALPGRAVTALSTVAELDAALGDVEVLLAPRPPRRAWAAARRLRLIQMMGAGVDALLPADDLPAAVHVAGVRGVFAAEAAEHALALLLAQARALPTLVRRHDARRWRSFPAGRVEGSAVAVLGLGEVGLRVARACAALGMEVRGVRRRPRSTPPCASVVGPEAVLDALDGAAFVVVTLPSTPDTRALIDARALARLPRDAVLVNVGRGDVVDEVALVDALRRGELGGAALDVVGEEPLPADSPLWVTPNLFITPHVAGLGRDYVARCVAVLADNVGRLERGEPPRRLVDRALGY